MRPLIAGHWKMNGMARQRGETEAIAALAKAAPLFAEVLICPPAKLIARAVQTAAGSGRRAGRWSKPEGRRFRINFQRCPGNHLTTMGPHCLAGGPSHRRRLAKVPVLQHQEA